MNRLTPEQRQRNQDIAAMFNAGMSISQIAKHYGRSNGTIGGIITRAREAGLIKRRPSSTIERDAQIILALAEGKTQAQVAEQFGLCHASINRILTSQPGYVPRAERPKGDRREGFLAPGAAAIAKPVQQKPAASPASNAQLIAEYLASKQPTKCPTVALTATQAEVSANLGLRDPWSGKTSWPASEKAMEKSRDRGLKGSALGHRSNRKGVVV